MYDVLMWWDLSGEETDFGLQNKAVFLGVVLCNEQWPPYKLNVRKKFTCTSFNLTLQTVSLNLYMLCFTVVVLLAVFSSVSYQVGYIK